MAQELKQVDVNVDLQYLDWVNVAGRLLNKDTPDKGGWNLFLTGASGPTMHSPLTHIGTAMTCDGKNWVGWPCDQTAEKLRQDFLEVAAIDAQRAAAVRLQERLVAVHPYRVLGQYDQPVAMRADLSGFLSVPVIVYWNIEKNRRRKDTHSPQPFTLHAGDHRRCAEMLACRLDEGNGID